MGFNHFEPGYYLRMIGSWDHSCYRTKSGTTIQLPSIRGLYRPLHLYFPSVDTPNYGRVFCIMGSSEDRVHTVHTPKSNGFSSWKCKKWGVPHITQKHSCPNLSCYLAVICGLVHHTWATKPVAVHWIHKRFLQVVLWPHEGPPKALNNRQVAEFWWIDGGYTGLDGAIKPISRWLLQSLVPLLRW